MNKLKMNFISVLLTVAVIACIVVFNMTFGIIADKQQLDIDLTQDNVYEFSELTNTTIKGLKSDVTVYLLEYEGIEYAHLEQLLEKYAAMNDHFVVKRINPYENPEIMNQFTDLYQSRQNPTLVILKNGDLYRGITYYEIFPQSYSGDQSIDAERQITNGLRYVVGELDESVVAFTVGHNESDTSVLISRMIEEGYRYSEIDLKAQTISEDTSVVISYMPVEDFSETELEELNNFTANGGSFVLISSSRGTGDNIQSFINKWGITANRDFVLDSSDNYIFHEGVYSMGMYMQEHTINKSLMESDMLFLSPLLPNTLTISNSSNGAVVTPILKSSPDSYAKNDTISDEIEYVSGDPIGPFVMGAISEKREDGGKVCVIAGGVVSERGGSSFASEEYITNTAIANCDFTLNLINYLGGSNVETGIRAKNISPDTFTLESDETTRITVVLVIVIPVIILAAAFIVWIRRRFR